MTPVPIDTARDASTQPSKPPLGPDGEIDVEATLIAFRRLLGHLSVETNETPRTLLEDEFKRAPTDDFWRATIGAER